MPNREGRPAANSFARLTIGSYVQKIEFVGGSTDREFCGRSGKPLSNRFGYIFNPSTPEGGGIPRLILNLIPGGENLPEALKIEGVEGVPLPLKHSSKDCLGYRVDSVASVTDCSYKPALSLGRLVAAQVRARKTFLTHLGHDFDHAVWSRKGKLLKGVQLAYDGLKITS